MSDCANGGRGRWSGVEWHEPMMVEKESGRMSKAYICDKCGLILSVDAHVNGIWLKAPFYKDDTEPIHLCDECYAQFERDYLANMNENGGVS